MTIQIIPITSRERWLSLRKYDINASNVAAINGLHPYKSALRLYHEKLGDIDFEPEDDSKGPLRRGRILESAIGQAASEQRPDWKIEKCTNYYRDVDISLAATPDFFVHGDPRGLGNMQGKTVAPNVFSREWMHGETIKPPTWIIIQTLAECMLTDAAFGVVAVLVVDPYEMPCHIIEIPRHPTAEAKIRQDVLDFWKLIEQRKEPGADYGLDRELLAKLMPHEKPDLMPLDLSQDNEIVSGLIERAEIKDRQRIDDARCKEIETQIMAKMGLYNAAVAPDFKVTWKTESRKEYTVPAKSRRVLRIYDRRQDDAETDQSASSN